MLLIWISITVSIAVHFIAKRKFVKIAGRWQIRKFGLKFIGSDVKACKGRGLQCMEIVPKKQSLKDLCKENSSKELLLLCPLDIEKQAMEKFWQ